MTTSQGSDNQTDGKEKPEIIREESDRLSNAQQDIYRHGDSRSKRQGQ